MTVDKSTLTRRVPQRPRGERRVAELLEAAAQVIAEVGYEAMTLATVSERAGTSVGAIYQYFDNKEAVGRALVAIYSDELEARWTRLVQVADRLSTPELVDRLFFVLMDFLRARRAFIPLLNAPVNFRRDESARLRQRELFAGLFRKRNPSLTKREALRVAYVTMELFKAMNPISKEAPYNEQPQVVGEFKRVLSAYLVARLDDVSTTIDVQP